MTTEVYVCDHAWLPTGRVADEVVVEVEDGRFTAITPRGDAPPRAERLGGLVLPGLANAHSHTFHRALRARTHDGGRGSFWTWRERMYAVAARIQPDTLLALARATFTEAVLGGSTTVGEFHYLHHRPGGVPYEDRNELGHVVIQAAREAGIRLTLLDTCYLTGGFDRAVTGVQRRFGDGDADRWATRMSELESVYRDADDVVIGAAIHSVRAVPRDQLPIVASWADEVGAPLHAHVSEQRAEDTACLDAHWMTPTGLLDDAGAIGPRTTAVHATHATPLDLATWGERGAFVCLCPTTERDLADGVGRARAMLGSGIRLALGSDSHAVTDLFEEARAVELDLRLATGERGHLTTRELLDALTVDGHASLGVPDAGTLAVGARADLVAVRLDSVRTAGIAPPGATAVFAATASDVTDVVVGGRRVVRDGVHALGDVGTALHDAIAAVTDDLEVRA